MNLEEKHLSEVQNLYDEIIEDCNLKHKNLKELYKGDYDAMMDEKEKLEHKIQIITKAKDNPYFARIDFKSSLNEDICYIGKVGISDFDNNVITVDWRAPISSLYYDSNLGKTSYNAPKGIIDGELLLKRQYTIEQGNLIDYKDVDTVSNDEILKPYLSVSMDNRLKNIVSTIQSEQNMIIRETLSNNLVIQGVAGSGKTTVALHRIAYLVYTYRDLYKPSDYLVIGPNKFFVNYISDILPDLDVTGTPEYTLEEILNNFLNDNYVVDNLLDNIYPSDISNIKSSMLLKNKIDKYFEQIEIIPNTSFKINGINIISYNTIINIYKEINTNVFKSIKSRVNKLILLLTKYINDNIERIVNNLIKNNIDNKIINELKNNLNYHIKKHFKILSIKTNDIYINILNNLNIDTSKIKRKNIDILDIPSLIYIEYLLNGNDKYNNFKHIVIDEAQDYSEFTFYVIRKIFKNATFSIYGDLAQSLYSYRSIKSWNGVLKMFDAKIMYLDKSYRTTIEIMNEANIINKKMGLKEAIPVIRHGDKVTYTNESILDILDKLTMYKTIAIITKNQNESNKLYDQLNKINNINLITSANLEYKTGINIIPSYLSKGLEFDAVIIVDTFNKDDTNDLKLLYVSITRALHKLYIKGGNNGEISALY